MNFTEFDFWPRLLVCLLLILAVRRLIPSRDHVKSAYDRGALGCLSLYLLACVGMLTFTIFISVFLAAWAMIHIMFRLPKERRPLVLKVGIPILLLPLFYYKYRFFIAKDVLGWKEFTVASMAIPAGISFYTFQKIAMLVDASKLEEWKPKFVDYLNFASFFPQVVAGPIERRKFLFPQMESFSFDCLWQRFNAGAPWLAIGFFYKLCLADNLTGFLNRDAMDSAWPIALVTFLFGLKIYFDFCGYSLIALGLAKCIGVNITLNFRSPYWSGNIREFWRRWHISLSYWFRDYVYIPLGGGLTGLWAVNLIIVFLLSGVWHGAGWGFILWGGLHGVFCTISHFWKGRFSMPWLIGWPLTVAAVFLSWLPFYETRLDVLVRKVEILLTPSAWSLGSLTLFVRSFPETDLLTLFAAIALCLFALGLEGMTRLRGKDDYAYASHPLTIVLAVVAVIILGASQGNEFVYFAF